MNNRYDPALTAALRAFYEEASLYCKGINDEVAREFAAGYVRMIEQQEEGLESQFPKDHHQLFKPTRRWICATLEEMRARHFPVR